jgi:TIR domain
MSSLADLPELVGFFSYSREDDEAYKGRLSNLREAIQQELGALLGRSNPNFRIFQDKSAIAPGTLWEQQIRSAVEQSVFFIPIVTPRAINSKYCRFEFEAFLERERALNRSNLVFPILYVPVPALANEAQWRGHPVLSVIGQRQYVNWQTFRHTDVPTPAMLEGIGDFCVKVAGALYEPWVSPEERKGDEKAQARARAEEEDRRRKAEAEERAAEEARQTEERAAAARVAEARRVQEAEAERQREAALSRERAEAAARRQAEEERRSREVRATQDAGQGRAFAAAKAAGTIKMVDAFLSTYPEGQFAEEAKALRSELLKRDNAYQEAMSSEDMTVLNSFLAQYPKGRLADQVRSRLLRHQTSAIRSQQTTVTPSQPETRRLSGREWWIAGPILFLLLLVLGLGIVAGLLSN